MGIARLTAATAALLLLLAGQALADTIVVGDDLASGRDGTGSLAFVGAGPVATDIHVAPGGIPGDSAVDYGGGPLDGYTLRASATKYDLRGYAEWIDGGPGTDSARSGSFFRDELFLVTGNGAPASITLEFAVDVDMAGLDPSFVLSWAYYPGAGGFVPFDGFSTGASFHGPVSLPSVMGADTYLFKSASYIPFSVGAWGFVNAEGDFVQWDETISLSGARVHQDGRLLGPGEYELTAMSGSGAFPGGPAAPEPATLLLLVAGGCALARLSRRRDASSWRRGSRVHR